MSRSKYYKILGLPDGATETEVRKKYRKLVMQYHPDKNPSAEANEKFLAVTLAYEILTGKRKEPTLSIGRAKTNNGRKTEAEDLKQKEQRAKEAQARYKQQKQEEHLENERYYQNLTSGAKWKTIRVSAIIGAILSLMILSDYVLPRHYDNDAVTAYNLNYARGLGGKHISLIKTEKEDFYWVENITYDLYGRKQEIYVESSWFFHNPIRLIAKQKVSYTPYIINFNFYKISWLLIILFLIPLYTIYYKRKKISFTVLYHFSYYGVNSLMLVYLITGNRWAHVLTFGAL